jgi:hypothetical protein
MQDETKTPPEAKNDDCQSSPTKTSIVQEMKEACDQLPQS